MHAETAALPRLLYIGDVSVADTTAGEALLFRLLQSYPAEKLFLVCGAPAAATALPGVQYYEWSPWWPRLFHSRVAEEYVLWRAWRYHRIPAPIAAIAATFRPEAILTISHVSAWLCAAQLAAARGIPLHMIAHDDEVYMGRFPQWSRGWAARRFAQAYRDAAARFCISDTMADLYEQRFGVKGSVIYPTRGAGQPVYPVADRLFTEQRRLTFAYGGSINTPAQFGQIARFARIVGAHGHRLIVYTPQHAVLRAAAAGIAALDLRGPVSPDALATALRSEADCLLLPQPLGEAGRVLEATLFPSKWADYSRLGLPVLVWAPPWSSSARFVARHPDVAEFTDRDDDASVEAAVARLAESRHRVRLAERVVAVGREFFAPAASWRVLHDALKSAR